MIEKVNPSHPDKVADRIAGAIVDLGYEKKVDVKIAVEVLIGHGECNIIIESNTFFVKKEIEDIVFRISKSSPATMKINLKQVPQDVHLAANQKEKIRCGDNGIFRGVPLTQEQMTLSRIARKIYKKFPTDGKYILADNKLIVCQSNATNEELRELLSDEPYELVLNPLGEWTGGSDVDCGCTCRKLGSDMADSITGGGLHGKDVSKADVSANIYAFLRAQETHQPVELFCAIGDEEINGIPYETMVEKASKYIQDLGGFEALAEWGLF